MKNSKNNVAFNATFTQADTKRVFSHFAKYGGIIGFDCHRMGRDPNGNPIRMASLNTYKDKNTIRDAKGSKNVYAKLRFDGNFKMSDGFKDALCFLPDGILVASGIDGIDKSLSDTELVKACEMLASSGNKLRLIGEYIDEKWYVSFATVPVRRRAR